MKEKKANKHRVRVRSRAFFENCRILKPDGSVVSCCSAKGMRWYLKKGLAEEVDDKTIRLNFEPKMKGLPFDEYHRAIKVSQCFVCGTKHDLCKYQIVPECYRVFIDDRFNNKAWRNHDHIPLCLGCHGRAMCAQNAEQERLCRVHGVPHFRAEDKGEDYKQLHKIKKAAWALSG